MMTEGEIKKEIAIAFMGYCCVVGASPIMNGTWSIEDKIVTTDELYDMCQQDYRDYMQLFDFRLSTNGKYYRSAEVEPIPISGKDSVFYTTREVTQLFIQNVAEKWASKYIENFKDDGII